MQVSTMTASCVLMGLVGCIGLFAACFEKGGIKAFVKSCHNSTIYRKMEVIVFILLFLPLSIYILNIGLQVAAGAGGM